MSKASQLILSALAGAVVIFIQAGVFFGFVFADFFGDRIPSELTGVTMVPTNYALIIVSDPLCACMLVFVFAGSPTSRRFVVLSRAWSSAFSWCCTST